MRHKRNIFDDVRYGSNSSAVSVDENGIINIHIDGTDVNPSNTYYNLYYDTIDGLFELGKTYYFTTGCLTKNCYIRIYFRNNSGNIISFSTQYDSYFTIPNNPEITKCIIRIDIKAGVYPDGVDEYCYPIITECNNIFDNKNDYSIKSIESYKDESNNIDLNNIISSGSYIMPTSSTINYINYPDDENYDNNKASILDVKSFYSKYYVYILQTISRLDRSSFSSDIYFERLLTISLQTKDAIPSIYRDWKAFNIPENSSSSKQERYVIRAINPQSDVEKYPEAIHGSYNSSGNITPRTDAWWTITYERLCDNSRFMYGNCGNISCYFLDKDKKQILYGNFSTMSEGQNYGDVSLNSDIKYINYFVNMGDITHLYFKNKIFETNDPNITFDELCNIYDKYSLEPNKTYYLPLKGESFSAANNNEEFIYDHKVFCSYDHTQFDHTENMYYLINLNSDGSTDNRFYITEQDQSQEEDPILTWFIKPKNNNKWFLINDNNTTSWLALFDENKNYITSIKAVAYGYIVNTKETNYEFEVHPYIFQLPWNKIDFTYIGVNYKRTDNPNISSSPIYKGIIINKKYGDIEFIGNKIINKPVFSGSLNLSKLYTNNANFSIIDDKSLITTSDYDDSNIIHTECVYLPAGTKIKCGPTGILCDLRGIDNFEYDYHAKALVGRDYTVPYDFYGHININRENTGWNWSDKFNMSSLPIVQLAQFVQVISPDEQECNQWAGKHWYAYGTSITDIGPDDTTGNNGHSGKYPLYLDMVSGMIRHNGAIGSGGIYNKEDRLNYKKNILATPADADLVTIETLPNDSYSNETALGTIDDYTNDTILGNLNQCLDYLVNETHAKVVLIFIGSSSSNKSADDKKMFDSLSPNRKAYRKAVNMIKELAELYGIDVIDCDMHAWAFEQRGWGNLMADWIHPSHLGGWMLGRYIWSKLKQMQPNPKYPEIDTQAKSQFEYSNDTN